MCKLELKHIYDKKAEGAKIRSTCEWYQHREKLTKFILNLEKQKAINTIVRHLIDDDKCIALPNHNSKSFDICKSEVIEKDLIIALKSMPTGKSPGHDGLNKEFYEQF